MFIVSWQQIRVYAIHKLQLGFIRLIRMVVRLHSDTRANRFPRVFFFLCHNCWFVSGNVLKAPKSINISRLGSVFFSWWFLGTIDKKAGSSQNPKIFVERSIGVTSSPFLIFRNLPKCRKKILMTKNNMFITLQLKVNQRDLNSTQAKSSCYQRNTLQLTHINKFKDSPSIF